MGRVTCTDSEVHLMKYWCCARRCSVLHGLRWAKCSIYILLLSSGRRSCCSSIIRGPFII